MLRLRTSYSPQSPGTRHHWQPWLLDQLEIATEFQAACCQRSLLTPLKTKDCLSHIKAYQLGELRDLSFGHLQPLQRLPLMDSVPASGSTDFRLPGLVLPPYIKCAQVARQQIHKKSILYFCWFQVMSLIHKTWVEHSSKFLFWEKCFVFWAWKY